MNEEFLIHGPQLMAHSLVMSVLISKCLDEQEIKSAHAALTDQIGEQLRRLGGTDNQDYAAKMEAMANSELDMLFIVASLKKR